MQRRDGRHYENAAALWLERNGLRTLARNFRTRSGELDIVALERDCVVFVEVRSRTHVRFGGAAASVGPGKQIKLLRAAQGFLQCNPALANQPCRFDVLAYEGAASGPRWIRAAFSA